MGQRHLSTNHSCTPPAWGHLRIVIQSHVSHYCHPTIAFPQPRAIFTSSSKAMCLQSCHLPIALSQPRAIFTSLLKPMCLQSCHPPIALSMPEAVFTSSSESTCIWSHCQPIAHSHLHPEIFTASSCLHSCLCILAGDG